MLHGEGGEEAAHFVVAELSGRSAADEGLEACHPEAICFQGPARIVAQFNRGFEVSVLSLPGSWARPESGGWRLGLQLRQTGWRAEAGEMLVEGRVPGIGAG